MSTTPDLPRTIHLFWSQGFAQAPPLVRHCLDRWRDLHPDWDVRAHDLASVRAAVDLGWLDERERLFGRPLTPLEISDIVRLDLLAEHGGVWTDATVFPTVPLDDWLAPVVEPGFFAFRDPGPDRLLSTWFLAARPGDPLVTAYRDAVHDYWRSHRFDRQDSAVARAGTAALTALTPATPSARRRLVDRRATDVLRRHPYFWLHYLFAVVLHRRPDLRRRWEAGPAIDAVDAHRVHRRGPVPLDDDVRRHIDEQRSPLYKLSHRVDLTTLDPSTALHHLFTTYDRDLQAS